MVDAQKRDFGTLQTERIASAGLGRVQEAAAMPAKAAALAGVVAEIFDDYYTRSRKIPWLAKRAFETRNWPAAIDLSQERIAIYSLSIQKAVPILKHAIREIDHLGGFWNTVEERYRAQVAHRYEADLALAYLASLRRWVYEDSWVPVEYDPRAGTRPPAPDFVRSLPADGRMTPALAEAVFAGPALDAPWRDRAADAAAVAERINEELGLGPNRPLTGVEVLEAGFYRNRGAYAVGALTAGGERSPLGLALLHAAEGITVDAVILREPTLRHVFSSTLANFHVTVSAYHELVDYLHGLIPSRPRGLHYSTVGYNHVGKLAVMEQITAGLDAGGETLGHAPGPPGSVAIGFTAPGIGYVAKVVRDHPTENYKWGVFHGIPSVLAKYRSVHELNRSGSMLDNILYQNLTLPRALFGEALMEELLGAASETVSLYRGELFFRHLIVQRKLTPVPLYLAQCNDEEAELVVIRLGQCIRNNAATNVFNKDLDGRNYGVSSLRFVYLFDYDALERLTNVKIRTNADREFGEEDVPDWVFEDGEIFLPEELEAHLRLPDRRLRRLFREAHGELLTAPWWQRMQRWLEEGRVPKVRTYPRAVQLSPEGREANLTLRPPD